MESAYDLRDEIEKNKLFEQFDQLDTKKIGKLSLGLLRSKFKLDLSDAGSDDQLIGFEEFYKNWFIIQLKFNFFVFLFFYILFFSWSYFLLLWNYLGFIIKIFNIKFYLNFYFSFVNNHFKFYLKNKF